MLLLVQERANTENRASTPNVPPARTPPGIRLHEIRRRIESSGTATLDWDGVERPV
jgi:hypothetical protein